MTITSKRSRILSDEFTRSFEGTGFLQLGNVEPGPFAVLTPTEDGEGLKIATKAGAFLVNLKTQTVTTEGTPNFEDIMNAFRAALNYARKP